MRCPKWFSLIKLYLILSFSRFIINKNINFNNKNYDIKKSGKRKVIIG